MHTDNDYFFLKKRIKNPNRLKFYDFPVIYKLRYSKEFYFLGRPFEMVPYRFSSKLVTYLNKKFDVGRLGMLNFSAIIFSL